MRLNNFHILIALIILTIITAYFSLKNVIFIILLLAFIKFILVTFYFMELKKAHSFWKVSIVLFLSLFLGIIYLIL